MNPKIWDLWIMQHPDLGKPHVVDHIKRNREKGFTVVIVSQSVFEKQEEDMRVQFRFINAGLADWGIENLYVPKTQHRELLAKFQSRMTTRWDLGFGSLPMLPEMPDAMKGKVIYG